LNEDFQVPTLIPFLVKLDEARFFYPPAIRDFLGGFHKDVTNLYVLMANRSRAGISDMERAKIGDKIVDELQRLEKLLQSMPQRFETDLKFPQLTSPRH
jgi:hypothetical protein